MAKLKTCREAKRYIKGIREKLTARGLIEDIDETVLMIWEDTFDDFIKSSNFLMENGTTFTKHTREGDKITESYPQVRHRLDAKIQLLKYAQEFGLTASSRKRVKDVAPPKDDNDQLTQFLIQK